ncbi:hypothetical protein [Aeromonas dhakensis]|uniref:hypothetical protein n=1 Tax=Aeromonas dhakensis TaxID=196024 RepID=UPI003BA2E34C
MHHTNEQDVVNAKSRIAELKLEYMAALEKYVNHNTNLNNGLSELLDCQKKGTEYFNYAEEFVGNSDLLGAHSSALWAQGFAEDCAEILKSMPAHFELLQSGFSKANSQLENHILPAGTAYANMQRMVVKYLISSEVMKIKKLFIENNLPIYGFNNQEKEFMSKKLQTILSFCFGVFFVVVLLVISFVQPNPSSFQYTIFRTILALAGAGAVAVFPGFIEVKFGNWLRAGGALAVFVVLYFYNPALPEVTANEIPEPNKSLKVAP